MQNFFTEVEDWPRLEGALHLYALPTPEFAERAADAATPLAGIENLPLMPASYFHFTIQRLAQFDDLLSAAQLSELGARLNQVAESTQAFELRFGPLTTTGNSVVAWAEPSQAWDQLADVIRDALTATTSEPLPQGPPGPHLTLAYATGEVSDSQTRELLSADALGPCPVAGFSLVSVTVRPELGIFDFITLADWQLSG